MLIDEYISSLSDDDKDSKMFLLDDDNEVVTMLDVHRSFEKRSRFSSMEEKMLIVDYSFLQLNLWSSMMRKTISKLMKMMLSVSFFHCSLVANIR